MQALAVSSHLQILKIMRQTLMPFMYSLICFYDTVAKSSLIMLVSSWFTSQYWLQIRVMFLFFQIIFQSSSGYVGVTTHKRQNTVLDRPNKRCLPGTVYSNLK